MYSKILIIEDDQAMCKLLKQFLTRHSFKITVANNGKSGIEAFKEENPDLVLCDFRLGDTDGISVLKKLKEINQSVPVIIVTGYSDIRTSVLAMRSGAYDYIIKPLFPDEILLAINKALDVVKEKSQNGSPKTFNNQNYLFGQSPASIALMEQIDLVAPTNFSVIIYGESGSGKEAVAQTIHLKSSRANKPFIAMDCGSISKELAGSELFGHEKGSFTGAILTKIGHFELANGGTLFLDEVANLPYEVQTSLLRVVQEKKIRKIGGNKEINVDVRLIIASNEDLVNAYKNKKFREDLFYRFNEFQISLLPLRERKEEIIMYADFFLGQTNALLGKKISGFDDEVINLFQKYPWYGNLRELKNVIKRAALLTEGKKIKPDSLPFEISHFFKLSFGEADDHFIKEELPDKNVEITEEAVELHSDMKNAAHEAEYEVILKVLKKVNFNKSKAAKILNIDRKTLYNKVRNSHP